MTPLERAYARVHAAEDELAAALRELDAALAADPVGAQALSEYE